MNLLALFPLLLLLGWLITAYLAGWLAGQKGRPVTTWSLIGLLLGPIAILAVGLSERSPSPPFKACEECTEVIYEGATKCPYCGSDLLEAESGA